MKQRKLPIAVSLSISRLGDFNDVPTEECGKLLLQAGRPHSSPQKFRILRIKRRFRGRRKAYHETCVLKKFPIFIGADIIGTNCRFAPDDVLQAALMMKDGIQEMVTKQQEEQQVHYICQPNGWQFPCTNKHGVSEEPECPFGSVETLRIVD